MTGTGPTQSSNSQRTPVSAVASTAAAGQRSDLYRYDVFISYSKADADWVWEGLLPRLKAAGLTICIDEESFEPGAPLVAETERAIRESRHTLVVLSPAWVESAWAGFESLLVQWQDPNARWRRLIPVLIAPCEPPERIQLLHWVDLTGADRRDAQLERVIQRLQGRSDLPELRTDLFPEPRRRLEPRWYAVAAVAALLTLAVLVGWILFQSRAASVMPAGEFNIAVAEFRALDAGGQPVKNAAAVERAASIAAFLESQADALVQVLGHKVNIWGPEQRIGPVAAGDEAARAEALNANVLVYGLLRQAGQDRWRLEPAFYLTDAAAHNADELAGAHALGTPIDYRTGSTASAGDVNRLLDVRLRALAQLLKGLSYYTGGDRAGYQAATATFQAAASNPEWGAAADGTGQEVLYLFLGNAQLKTSQFLEDDPPARMTLLDASRAAYEHAIALNPAYARSYNGLGSALFQTARPVSSDPDECHWAWDVLAQAQAAYTRALVAPAEAKPPSGFVDLRAHLGLGLTYFWQTWCPPQPDQPDLARGHLQAALDQYSALSTDDQTLLAAEAALIHTDLGHLAQSPAEAIPHYAAVVALAQQAGADDLLRQAHEILPYLLTAYCLDGQYASAKSALDGFVANLPDSASARTAILDRLAPETREECLPD